MGSFQAPRPSAVVATCIAAAVAIVVVVLFAAGFQLTRTILTVSSDPLRDVDLHVLPSQTPSSGVAGMIARGQRVNVLLLGYGGAGHDGAFLTDSLMVASIEPRTGTVALFSIPRDLWVTVPKSKYAGSFEAKINEAFAVAAAAGDRDEGMRVAASTIETVLGVPIDRTVAIDFRAFRTVVDALGGIDVTVDRSFTAMYPKNDDAAVDPSWIEISFKAGAQHMDGETALRYARARYSDGPEGNDFARAKRQQKVILAAKDRVVSADAFTQLFGLLEALRDNVRTDLSLSDIKALASFARGYEDEKTARAALSTDNVLQAGYTAVTGYALWPKVEGWREVHAYAARAIEYSASFSEDAAVALRISAPRAAIGALAVRRLADLGLRATLELVADDDPERTIVIDAANGAADATARFLSSYFGDAAVTSASGPARIEVRVGRDWIAPAEFSAPNESPSAQPSSTPAPPRTPAAPSEPMPLPVSSNGSHGFPVLSARPTPKR